MTAGPEQTDSPYHEAWILKPIAMIQTALIGPAQQWYSHLPLDVKKNWQPYCREFQKKFDNQQSQTQAKLLLESIKRVPGEQIKTLALRIEQMTRKAYVNNAPDMRNAQMNDALVKALDPQLARIALKKIADQKSTTLESQLPFAQLIEKIHQEDITRTHIDRHELNILLNTAKLLKNHYFAAEQQPLLSSPEKASRVSRTAFLFYLVEICGAQLTKGSVLFICNPLTSKYYSLIYDTLFNPLSDTLFDFFNEYGLGYNPWIDRVYFEKTPGVHTKY